MEINLSSALIVHFGQIISHITQSTNIIIIKNFRIEGLTKKTEVKIIEGTTIHTRMSWECILH